MNPVIKTAVHSLVLLRWLNIITICEMVWTEEYEMSCSVNMEAENDYQLAAQTDIVTFLLKK